ncbi:glycosyltransferase [Oleiharenicola lentus]|uniref:Glycosyltransferase n=1 Tax=Oleiharenicola lentus TaxID=2508720 RepID=A0A4Q1C9Y4_9BACT|nr:glycosyltransferase family 2 protein [Oleiharenicola lentus]RXK55690.1 glycosyltransferase [Oleiharenicola lentus]
MKTITLVSGCYNEEDNLPDLVSRVFAAAAQFPQYAWEYIIVDNCSTDGSRALLRRMAAEDKRIKVIFNTRNFGYIRSPYYGILQARGDAVIYLASDLQDPPELITQFIPKWEEGFKVVAAIKNESEESALFFMARKAYYAVVASFSNVDLLKNFTGFGLYDQTVVEQMRKLDDPYPYFRGIIVELGYPIARVSFVQPRRKRGFSKSNFYSLYDVAMLGFTNHSKVPLRLATMFGFALSALSFLIGLIYLVLKLILWREFTIGLAPVVVGLFFLGSVQLLFIGILGEYIGAIHTHVTKRPLVVEQERINF